jgi:hypothetical protein
LTCIPWQPPGRDHKRHDQREEPNRSHCRLQQRVIENHVSHHRSIRHAERSCTLDLRLDPPAMQICITAAGAQRPTLGGARRPASTTPAGRPIFLIINVPA